MINNLNRISLTIGLVYFMFPLIAVSQSVQLNNDAYLINKNNSYWVFDNGNFNISSDNDANPLEFENFKITNNASINILSQTNLTINDSLINNSNNLVLKSNNMGSASLITYGKITGKATVEKYLASSQISGHTVSSPVKKANQNLFDGAIKTYFYNPLKPGWDEFLSGELEIMRGYWTKFSSDETILFNDTLNTDTISYTNFYRTAPYGYGNMGWNFLGNPYPSAVHWDNVINLNGGTSNFISNTKLNNAVYVINSTGNYDTYIAGQGTNGFEGVISSNMAFWTQVNKDYFDALNPLIPILGAKLKFDNSVRVHESLTQGSKTTSDGIIRLFIERDHFKDETILRLLPNATFNFDPAFDAYKFISENSIAPQIYMNANSVDKIAINSLPDNASLPLSIPLSIVSSVNQLHKINIDISNFNKDNISVHLEDKLKNTFTDIRQTSYYNYTSLSTTDANRFVLHLGLSTGVNDFSQPEVNIYSYDNGLYITNLSENVTLSLYDMLGKLIYNKNLTDIDSKIEFNIPRAYYIVRLTGQKTNTVKKVLINTKYN